MFTKEPTFDTLYKYKPKIYQLYEWNNFWLQNIKEVRKKKYTVRIIKKKKSISSTYILMEFESFDGEKINIEFKKIKKKKSLPLIINLSDLNKTDFSLNTEFPECKISYRNIKLIEDNEGNLLNIEKSLSKDKNLFNENSILKKIFLDTFIAVDLVRKIPLIMKETEAENFIFLGFDIGGNIAFFLSLFFKNVTHLILDSPILVDIGSYYPFIKNGLAYNIIKEIKASSNKKNSEKIIRYFDAINMLTYLKIKPNTLVSLCFNDKIASPAGTFGLFNLLNTEKIIEIFPQSGHFDDIDKRKAKIISWLGETYTLLKNS